jgi:hypothetical protein
MIPRVYPLKLAQDYLNSPELMVPSTQPAPAAPPPMPVQTPPIPTPSASTGVGTQASGIDGKKTKAPGSAKAFQGIQVSVKVPTSKPATTPTAKTAEWLLKRAEELNRFPVPPYTPPAPAPTIESASGTLGNQVLETLESNMHPSHRPNDPLLAVPAPTRNIL